MNEISFWQHLDTLLQTAAVVIDRAKGSAHPRFPVLVYPLDYGYLQGTTSGDGQGIDVWRGTGNQGLDAILCTADLHKRDIEIKLLLNCMEAEKQTVLAFHNQSESMAAMLVRRVQSY